jgi:hypothetical protein
MGEASGASAHRRQERNLIAFRDHCRRRRKLLIQRQHDAARHLPEARETGGIVLENGLQPDARRELRRVLAQAYDIVKNTKKKNSDTHVLSY